MERRRPRRPISPERRGLYAVGITLQVAGLIAILVCFIGFALAGMGEARGAGTGTDPFAWWFGFFIGMVVAAVGKGVCTVAARGVAGSGIVLDPERAREDLGPWARAGGGLLKDALDEAGVGERIGHSAEPVVKVRCRECDTLNDEDARFCDACGGKL